MRLPTKNATSQTVDPNHPPGNLIDQDTNTFYSSSDVNSSGKACVQIELLDIGNVHEVIIRNPVNCCDNNTTSLEIRVGDNETTMQQTDTFPKNQVCGKYDGPQKNGDVIKIQCEQPLQGKYATIQNIGGNNTAIRIAEVELFGTFEGKQQYCNFFFTVKNKTVNV